MGTFPELCARQQTRAPKESLADDVKAQLRHAQTQRDDALRQARTPVAAAPVLPQKGGDDARLRAALDALDNERDANARLRADFERYKRRSNKVLRGAKKPQGKDASAAAAARFDPLRPRLIRVAYRMLGSVADAEDVVQDAFIRWMGTDRSDVREPEAFLRRIVTRLCLDQMKSARAQRETYVGPWLPEPLVEDAEAEPDDVTLPLMLALERLSPLERAAFLLHDVFGLAFDEVARTIQRDAAACRQLAARARRIGRRRGRRGEDRVHVRAAAPVAARRAVPRRGARPRRPSGRPGRGRRRRSAHYAPPR